MCTYFAIHVHILCGGIISGYLWIIWLFEGFSGSYLILLSTFPIQNIGIWYILQLRMVNFKIYIIIYFQFLSCNWEIITTFAENKLCFLRLVVVVNLLLSASRSSILMTIRKDGHIA